MKSNQHAPSSAYLMLHIAVFLFGFTAILGTVISVSGTVLVWYRLMITLVTLLFFPGMLTNLRKTSRKELLKLLGIGVLLILHWVTFYEAIKFANASITLSVLASASFFTSLIEPIFFRKKISLTEAILGLVVVFGFLFIFGFSAGKYLTGMLIALFSAVVVALVGVLNKVVVSRHENSVMMFVQFFGGWVFLTVLMPFYHLALPEQSLIPTWTDMGYILILAGVCTTFAYTLWIRSLHHLTAFTASLAVNLEPVYGMAMAAFFFKEYKDLSLGFYAGTLIILATVAAHPLLVHWEKKWRKKPADEELFNQTFPGP